MCMGGVHACEHEHAMDGTSEALALVSSDTQYTQATLLLNDPKETTKYPLCIHREGGQEWVSTGTTPQSQRAAMQLPGCW